MSRSPLDMMIDRACGIPDGWTPTPKPQVVRCPVEGCGAEKRCDRHPSDPRGTALVVFPCRAHGDVPPGVLPRYFDANGREIIVNWF